MADETNKGKRVLRMIRILRDICMGCGRCVELDDERNVPEKEKKHVCPPNLISMAGPRNEFTDVTALFSDPEGKCSACCKCRTVCPHLAIWVYKDDGKPDESDERTEVIK